MELMLQSLYSMQNNAYMALKSIYLCISLPITQMFRLSIKSLLLISPYLLKLNIIVDISIYASENISKPANMFVFACISIWLYMYRNSNQTNGTYNSEIMIAIWHEKLTEKFSIFISQ